MPIRTQVGPRWATDRARPALLGRSRRPSCRHGHPVWDARQVIVDRDAEMARALVEEACRKSALVWLAADRDRSQPGGVARLGRRRRARRGGRHRAAAAGPRGRQPRWTSPRAARTPGAGWSRSAPRSPPWRRATTPGTTVVPELHAKRLNPPDGEAQPARWARESRVVRIEPTGRAASRRPGTCRTGSHAAEPPGSPATTRGPLPFVVGRRARRRA